ncbi:MAG: DUF4436 family protein [Candidatus Nanopelagicales bacterium]|nr:DUF4436 family protein [Candidatus Nanopelagicales bacterium]
MSNAEPTPQLIPQPRPLTRRGRWVLVVCGAVIAVLYALVVHFYNAEGGSLTYGGIGRTDATGLVVTIEPVDVVPQTDRVTLNVSLEAQGAGIVDADQALINPMRVLLVSSLGTQEVKYSAGELLGRFETVIGLDGEQALYPFDNYQGLFFVTAETVSPTSIQGAGAVRTVPVGLQSDGGVSGWDTIANFSDGMVANAAGELDLTRSFSTRVFALLMLSLVIVLSGAALLVASMVFTNRRRAEVTLLTWTGAVLFALPLLRTYLPYGPPVGAAIDVYVYLWAIVAAVSAVTLLVVAWLRQNRAVLEAAREKTHGS